MLVRLIAAAFLIAAAAPVAAAEPPITAGEFLNRAEPLMKKSKVSLLLSGEARRLMGILGATAKRNRSTLDAQRQAGRKVTTCLPPEGKASVDAKELLAYLRALPPAQKAQSFDAAFAGYSARKYPCRS